MNARVIGLVYAKELRETLRDRRTLIVMVLLPLVLYPVAIFAIGQGVMMQHSATSERPSRVGVAGSSWAAMDQALSGHKQITVVRTAARGRKKGGEELDLLVTVPADYSRKLAADGTVKLRLTYDETRDTSRLALGRARKALGELGEGLRTRRLERRSLPSTFSEPLRLEEDSTAEPEEVGAHLLGRVLPLLAILMVLLGAFYPAIDLTAGEKERGTLETLLVAPVPRTALITGKFLVVATVATCTGLLNLGSLGLTVAMGIGPGLMEADASLQVPWTAVALTAVAIVPAALFFSAVMVAVAALARSFKEAQNLLTPVYMLCMIPAMAAMFPAVKLTVVTALIPAVNVGLLTRELIGGKLPLLPLLICLVSCLLYTVAALKLAASIYNSERMLFAPDPGRKVAGAAPASGERGTPDPLQAAILMLAVLGLILLVGQYLQAMDVITGLLVTEWVLIAAPVLLLIRFGRLDHRLVLSLRAPRALAVVGAVLAGLSGWFLVGVVVEAVQQRIMPMPKELMEQMAKTLFAGERNLALDLFAMALSPAICEELLFRGVILRASRARMGVVAAVVLNGVVFGVFHMSIYRFFPTMLLGMVLAVIVIRTRSIIPAMIFHFLNNGCAVVIGRFMSTEVTDAGKQPVSVPLVMAALALFVGGMALLGGTRNRGTRNSRGSERSQQ